MAHEVHTSRGFDRLFERLPEDVKRQTVDKVALYIENPAHPSLRVKRIKGTSGIWEMSVTMSYRLTFEVEGERVLLRRIGTHDILRQP